MGFPQTTQPQLVLRKSAGVLKPTIFHQPAPMFCASQENPSIWGLKPGQRYSFTLHSVLNPLEQSFEVESETSDWRIDVEVKMPPFFFRMIHGDDCITVYIYLHEKP